MKLTKENLPVNDASVSDDTKITESIFDICIGTESKEETTKIRNDIIRNQKLFSLVEQWMEQPDDYSITKTCNGVGNIEYTLLVLGRLHHLSKSEEDNQ